MSTFRLSLDFLPNEVVNDLTGLDQRITRAMLRLFNCRKEVVSYEYAHITPPLQWIADQVNSTVTVVSRSLKRLGERGIIRTRHRRAGDGRYRINSYTLGEAFRTLLKRFTDRKKGNKNLHLTKGSTVLNKETLEDNYFGHFISDLKGILTKMPTMPPLRGSRFFRR